MNSVRRAIVGEKVPYLATIFFAALGWWVTYSVDRVDKSPTVTFTTTVSNGPPKSMTVRVENITRDKVFQELCFSFLFSGADGKFTGGRATPVPPAWQGSSAPVPSADSLALKIEELQPGGKVDLVADYEGVDSPKFYLEQSKDTVRLIRPSLETFFVRHEILALCVVLILWAVAMLVPLMAGTLGASGGAIVPKPAAPPNAAPNGPPHPNERPSV